METIVLPKTEKNTPSRGSVVKMKWTIQNPPPHEFLAIICPEEEGGFSIYAATIPGVISQGETEDEARQNIAEAFLAMLEACRKRGEPLPYSARPVIDVTPDCRRIWIALDG